MFRKPTRVKDVETPRRVDHIKGRAMSNESGAGPRNLRVNRAAKRVKWWMRLGRNRVFAA
jgi:hypothetical protein